MKFDNANLRKNIYQINENTFLVVQISGRLREIWELTLFKKGVTPGDSPKI